MVFKGSMVALVTPLHDDEVDLPSLCQLVEHHIDKGSHALVVAGTTGESGTLSDAEKILVIKTVLGQARHRIPVIAGTYANATRDCIELTKAARELGVDAALIMSPAYIKPSQEGLYQHFAAIAKAVALPIILYNVPSRTASDLAPETVARLGEISNIVGIKEATGVMSRLKTLLDLCGDRVDVYSGDDASAAEWILNGARGVISVTANVATQLMAKISDAALDGDTAWVRELDEKLKPLHELMFIETNPIPVKWAVHQMGLIPDEIRLPLTSLTPAHQASLLAVMQRLDIV